MSNSRRNLSLDTFGSGDQPVSHRQQERRSHAQEIVAKSPKRRLTFDGRITPEGALVERAQNGEGMFQSIGKPEVKNVESKEAELGLSSRDNHLGGP